jgi:hypothetical protein
MSLDRDSLLEYARIEVTEVTDIPHFGTVYLRPYPESLRILRMSQADRALEPKWRAQRIIDLVTDSEGVPAFTQDDLVLLAELDSTKLDPVSLAISTFLSDRQKKSTDG